MQKYKSFIFALIVMLTGCNYQGNIPGETSNQVTSALSDKSSKKFAFPNDWLGNWSGTCKMVYPNQPDKFETFEMKLSINGLKNSPGKWEWKIEYLSSKINEIRNYELIEVSKGHYTVDEKNGIFLDSFLVLGDTMIDQFDVQSSRVTVKNKLLDTNRIQAEFITFSTQPVRTSGAGNIKVDSFGLLNYQDCLLGK